MNEQGKAQRKKMTLHKVLVEIKNLSNEISRRDYLRSEVCSAVKIATGKTKTGISKAESTKKCETNFQKNDALFKNLFRLKTALINVNQTTKLRDKINGVEYTIQEAILGKEMFTQRKNFLEVCNQQLIKIENEIVKANETVEAEVSKLLSKDGEQTSEGIELLRKTIEKNYGLEMVSFTQDPKEFIEKEIEAINEFLSQIDEQLSIINSLTEIEIDFV